MPAFHSETARATYELTRKTEPTGLRMTMLYDSVGNRTTLTEPDGYHYTFGYDALNRPIRLRDPNAYVLTFQYDAAGRRTTLLDSTGITRVYQYDSVGRLTTQVDSNSGGTGLVTFVDGYDAVGNRTSRIKDGVATTWVYDAAYRLTNQQKSGQAATFVYDNAGNITVKHHEGSNPLTMSYDAGNRITTSILGSSQFTTFTHDANGNMTGERCDYLSVLSTFVYDSENRCLNELRSSGAHHTYTYAPDGLRRSAHHGGAANPVSFVWDGDDLLNEYRLGGVSCRYDVLDGEVFGERRDGSRCLYVPDPLGSINHLLDTSQTIAGTYVYWPYGEVQSHTGPDTPLQFVGGLGCYTGVVNRVYVRARWYRPDLGRWQTVDPLGFAGGDWNLYGYVADGPVSLVDWDGLRKRGGDPPWRRRRRSFWCWFLGIGCPPESVLVDRWIRDMIKVIGPCSRNVGDVGRTIGQIDLIRKSLKCLQSPDELLDRTRDFYSDPEYPGSCLLWCLALVSFMSSCIVVKQYGDVVRMLASYNCTNECGRRGLS